jgi:heme exporter protein C
MFKSIKNFFHRQGSPRYFYQTCGALIPWFAWICVILMVIGLVQGLVFAPTAKLHGETYRIIYVHVPSATLSLSIYVIMAISAAIGLIWHIKTADIIAFSSAPIGFSFTLLALITGSIWGYPAWGTWWEWDARMTSELILLFMYAGIIGLGLAIEDRRTAANATAILTLCGVVLIPFIIISVDPRFGFNVLHQPRSNLLDAKEVAPGIAIPWVIMIFSFLFFYGTVLMMWIRNEILRRERNTQWVKNLVTGNQ